MARWLFKTEPQDYSFDDLQREGRTAWDGVTNNWAQKNMRDVRMNDEAFIYHTGDEKCITGIAKIVSDPYPDPSGQNVVFDIIPVRRLIGSVALSVLKNDNFFSEFMLIKFSRLSVMPVEVKYWDKILKLSQKAD